MGDVVDLLARRIYSFPQIDGILGLHHGTSSRWIDGYSRAGRDYEPVVRPSRTGDEVATWGEFVECRLLAEYRDAGVSIQRMRPAVEKLREQTGVQYPLASARLWWGTDGRELVAKVQEDVKLDKALSLVVVRTGQAIFDWSARANNFADSVRWSSDTLDGQVTQLSLDRNNPEVEVDPLRGYGDPVIRGRSVPTSILSELVQAGEPIESIAESYSLEVRQVEAALRYELGRRAS
jgi:uncharacterized protein (DUF433 family)